jgi:hypothetical protein
MNLMSPAVLAPLPPPLVAGFEVPPLPLLLQPAAESATTSAAANGTSTRLDLAVDLDIDMWSP